MVSTRFVTISLASRAGIKKSMKDESESDEDSDVDMGLVGSGSEDSDSSSSGSEDSVDSEDDKPRGRKVVRKPVAKKSDPKKKSAAPKKKATSPPAKSKKTPASTSRKRKVESESEPESDADEAEGTSNQNEVKVLKQVQNRSPKETLVAGVLSRWWYAMPEWPPAGYDYPAQLQKHHLRLVTLDKWEDEPDTDKDGRMKCYALSQYPGLFRDAKGGIRDMRPIEGKPCYSELMKKSDKELQGLLSDALTKQIDVLSQSRENNTATILADLKEKLKNVRKK